MAVEQGQHPPDRPREAYAILLPAHLLGKGERSHKPQEQREQDVDSRVPALFALHGEVFAAIGGDDLEPIEGHPLGAREAFRCSGWGAARVEGRLFRGAGHRDRSSILAFGKASHGQGQAPRRGIDAEVLVAHLPLAEHADRDRFHGANDGGQLRGRQLLRSHLEEERVTHAGAVKSG